MHLASQPSFLCPEQRPWRSLVGQCVCVGEVPSRQLYWALQKPCAAVPAACCPQLLSLDLFWSPWSRERCLASTRTVGFHGDLDAKPALSVFADKLLCLGSRPGRPGPCSRALEAASAFSWSGPAAFSPCSWPHPQPVDSYRCQGCRAWGRGCLVWVLAGAACPSYPVTRPILL